MGNISRYKQLYNALTHSKAFTDKDSVLHSDAVNKGTFTPHNLKSIILGSQGAIAIYYTTNSVDKSRVWLIHFNNWMGSESGIDKGLVNALCLSEGLNFNNVEEVYLCLDGFSPEELQREQNAFNAFVSSVKSGRPSFPRLMRVGYCSGSINVEELKKSNLGNIAKLLQGQGVSIKGEQLNPRRNELGLLPTTLDNGNYALDKKYTPDLPDSEKGKVEYRLSKYFYDIEQRALKMATEQKQESKEEKKEEKSPENNKGTTDKENEKKARVELLKKYDEQWGSHIKDELNAVMSRMETLYASNFSGVIAEPWGLLTGQGVLKAYSSERKIAPRADNRAQAILLYKALIESMKDTISGFNWFRDIEENELVDYSVFLVNKVTNPLAEVMYNFHTRICFGYLETCVGLKSFLQNNKKIKTDYSTATKVKNYEHLKGYILACMKEIIYQAFIDKAIPVEIKDTKSLEIAHEIIEKFITIVSNVIVIPEQKKSVFTEIRVSTQLPMDVDRLVSVFSSKIHQRVDKISYTNGVLSIRVLYDVDAYTKTDLFAKDTLDGIIASGEPISWSHALLGKKEDGTPLFWDNFKDAKPSKRTYTIYAESRAGKGIMTSTLLCNALANGYKLLYIDGKPENGVGTGKIAWNEGLEAAIYDGGALGAEPYTMPLENYTNGLRSVDMAYQSMYEIPDGVFLNDEDKKKFVALCTYLRGIELATKAINYRMTQNKSDDDWVVMVFDELRKMAEFESDIRDIFKERVVEFEYGKYESSTRTIKVAKAKKDADENKIAAGRWIKSWFDWLKEIRGKFGSAVTIGTGKANVDMFFIFQGSDWFEGFKDTFLVHDILLKGDNTKIIGFGGVSGKGGNGKYGDGNAVRYNWVKKINDETNRGTWAITHSPNVNQCDSDSSVTLFKPFNVYLEPRAGEEDVLDIPDTAEGGDLKYKYIGPYISKMMGALGIEKTPAEVLNEGFIYFDNFVRDMGLGSDLNSFMYDAIHFAEIRDDEEDEEPVPTDASGSYDFMPGYDEAEEKRDREEDFDLFGDNESKGSSSQSQSYSQSQRPQRQQAHGQQSYAQQGQPFNNAGMGNQSGAQQRYTGTLHIENNPFATYSTDSNNDILLSTKEFSEIILEDIRRKIGSPEMITDFVVNVGGGLIFNGIQYFPQFEDSFLQTLPVIIQKDLQKGALVNYFDLGQVYNFSSLETFCLESETLAQGRARKEMAIGFRKRWSVLFKKFPYLRSIYVGGIDYYRENPDTNVEQSWLDKFRNNPASTFASGTKSRMDKVWDSKPVRVLANAFGWTMGVKAVWLAATMFGPMGLLFGALVAAGAYSEYKKEKDKKQLEQPKVETPKQLEAPKIQKKKAENKTNTKRDTFNPLKK